MEGENVEDLAAVRKELQTVKTRAVNKIKSLQTQVAELQKQLAERPPDSSSSEGSEKGGFVKVRQAVKKD